MPSLSTSEVATRLGVTPRRVVALVKSGRLTPTRRVGPAYLFDADEVERFSAIERKHGVRLS